MNSTQIGKIGESKVLFEFTVLGIPCYLPYGEGNVCDLVVDFKNKLHKIQIKTTEKVNQHGAMEWKITRQDGFHGSRTPYNSQQVDYFCLYCMETDIVCMVPFNEQCPHNTISIRLDNYNGPKRANIRYASDFSIKQITS